MSKSAASSAALFLFLDECSLEPVHLDEPQMNDGKLRHKDEQIWVRNSADNADSTGVK
jgi:hypothetical protein